ncbi:hypothetical protein ElyMa_006488100 [Elysia marginata]|uniref:Uncharacterized protein n=1 Tax=Elysia marginata TaxID=1093978 RepID=A0AAV4I3R8_9GAST|nr:hypothetical protein ElyMa_006488100 [Elysia marginata]
MPVRRSRPGRCSPRSQPVFASIWWRLPNLPRACNAMSLSWSMRILYLQAHPPDARDKQRGHVKTIGIPVVCGEGQSLPPLVTR